MLLCDASLPFDDIATDAGASSNDTVLGAADGPAAAAHPRATASAGVSGITSHVSVRSYQSGWLTKTKKTRGALSLERKEASTSPATWPRAEAQSMKCAVPRFLGEAADRQTSRDVVLQPTCTHRLVGGESDQPLVLPMVARWTRPARGDHLQYVQAS